MLPSEMAWLPNSCAYRLRADNKPLPQWHPLISGKQSSVHKETKSIRGRVVSEVDVDEADLENYIIRWILLSSRVQRAIQKPSSDMITAHQTDPTEDLRRERSQASFPSRELAAPSAMGNLC